MNSMQSGESVLHKRYTLESPLSNASGSYEVWNGSDEFAAPVLIKLWPYKGERPDDGDQALWDYELRNLFRLASLPEAEESLLVLRDTGIDQDIKRFVMVFKTTDTLSTLETLLGNRRQFPWLSGISDRSLRAETWRGLRKLASGLAQLHDQQILHRAIAASTIYVESTSDPETLRLAGFEWSIRVGVASSPATEYPHTLTPPEYTTGSVPYSFNTDWFLLGALFARILAAADPPSDIPQHDQYTAVIDKVSSVGYLSGSERELILALLDTNPEARLSQNSAILRRIDQILSFLEQPLRLTADSHLALVVLLGPSQALTRAVQQEQPQIQAFQTNEQRLFIQDDLHEAQLVRYGSPSSSRHMLIGQKLCYSIREYSTAESPPTGRWDKAYAVGLAELRHSDSPDNHVKLTGIPIKVFELREVRRNRWQSPSGMIPWKNFLPRTPNTPSIEISLQRLYDFFRTTNQIELLMRDAEIFSFRVLEQRVIESGTKQEIIIEEIPRERPPSDIARLNGSLTDYMRAQMERQQMGDLFYLGEEEGLTLGRRPRSWFWNAQILDENRIGLTRAASPDANTVPEKGFIRSFEQFGQIALINRRLQAINRLRRHGYLMLALQAPEHVYIDTEANDLPISIDPGLDSAKRKALRNLWRTRPIFALQGPPGTGKTTLVAHLLRHIFADDAVAQVLITAQAHSAVDVLRERVSRELRATENEFVRPIQIRLSTQRDNNNDPDQVEQVTDRILKLSEETLTAREGLNDIQKEWVHSIGKIRSALRTGASQDGAPDMCELVKRAANITFCTTTAGDLAELATSTQRFDWSIIEEAGKAHGFDLVLPLQTGHRWLLIGDHAQLPPYRHRDFDKALANLDEVMEDLRHLPERGGRMVEVDLINKWNSFDANERNTRRDLYRGWLTTFKHLHQVCGDVPWAGEDINGTEPAPLTSMLSHQHRMHPTIAELISRAYYGRRIVSETIDANNKPKARVVHPFCKPSGIENAQIVWIDVPKAQSKVDQTTYEGRELAISEVQAISRFLGALRIDEGRSSGEQLDVAVLSPYRRQLKELSLAVAGFFRTPPSWMKASTSDRPNVFTVDSFQGNQADVVIVSLVRNNDAPPGKGMGFLDESSRMNVLFSRSERLLVLVGCWHFFCYQVSGVSPDSDHYLGHWKIAIEYIEECFQNGTALLLPSDQLGGA